MQFRGERAEKKRAFDIAFFTVLRGSVLKIRMDQI